MKTTISIEKTKSERTRHPEDQLGFGKYFADHMFIAEYSEGSWKEARIVPYGPLSLDPGASVFHYGQALFEGMKAFRGQNDRIHLFRPDFHVRRLAHGAEKLCMPSVPAELFTEAVEALVKVDSSWIPKSEGSALYLRPTLIGTESFLGVRPSQKYLFFIITSPVGPYYSEGFNPVKIWIERSRVRAAVGGLGDIKAGANYAASLAASTAAKKKDFAQVLWLDSMERKYIEEVGTMNVFFKINDEVITPALNGSILAGATRDCVIQLLKSWNIPVTERKISIDEVFDAHKTGQLKEVFGSGTAAVVSSVGELADQDHRITINNNQVGDLTKKLLNEITSIQLGKKSDPFGWVKVLES
ncbi:branched-chain amino acid aminotransferase [Pseudobdellovibrio exovorus]|uniref:branched-chain-amino-acid transaminase n=1 Tax=Pseudobdellovibrio exovorus JSS TaxID=1184267 RepID=M4VCZ8_9BACT|nr:branched-chain amino acid aminotransferase [Pseudobdellovibrio exovorus]AGH95911.1 hypothetical protein A11Q_1695 [Pseudobdellovibrio exovorus JSS]